MKGDPEFLFKGQYFRQGIKARLTSCPDDSVPLVIRVEIVKVDSPVPRERDKVLLRASLVGEADEEAGFVLGLSGWPGMNEVNDTLGDVVCPSVLRRVHKRKTCSGG